MGSVIDIVSGSVRWSCLKVWCVWRVLLRRACARPQRRLATRRTSSSPGCVPFVGELAKADAAHPELLVHGARATAARAASIARVLNFGVRACLTRIEVLAISRCSPSGSRSRHRPDGESPCCVACSSAGCSDEARATISSSGPRRRPPRNLLGDCLGDGLLDDLLSDLLLEDLLGDRLDDLLSGGLCDELLGDLLGDCLLDDLLAATSATACSRTSSRTASSDDLLGERLLDDLLGAGCSTTSAAAAFGAGGASALALADERLLFGLRVGLGVIALGPALRRERHAERGEQRRRPDVAACAGGDRDVHAADAVDRVVVDLREDDLLP